ncbi:MAG: tetratricopeptide repeat protein [Vicinamibacterales bacterium]|nr:tetratricopeptide repeat protein [Vicinamibacterales bacterium]
MRALILTLLLATAVPAGAQPALSQGGTDRVAALNVEAKRLSDGEPEKAMPLARQAVELARQQGDLHGEAEALHNIAVSYLALGALDLAAETAQASAGTYGVAGNARGEAQGYNTLGLIRADDGDFAGALEAHLQALAIRERIDDKAGLAYSYNNIANVYRHTGQYARSLEYHEQSLALKLELGDVLSEAFSHHNIGLVYQAMGDLPRALNAFRRGMALRETVDDDRGVGSSLNSIGQIESQTDPAAALATYRRALELRQRGGDRRGEAATQNNIGRVLLRLGDTAGAIAAYERALAVTTGVEAPLLRVDTLRGLSDAERARGNHQVALARLTESIALRDQVFNQENAERISRLQAAHESQRQEQRIALLERDGALRTAALEQETLLRYALIAGLVLGGISLTLLYARYQLKQKSEAALRAQADELKAALDRVQTLRGLLPICASCKNIRDDNGYWTAVEAYIGAHSAAEFTHSICPNCAEKLYPDVAESTRLGRH